MKKIKLLPFVTFIGLLFFSSCVVSFLEINRSENFLETRPDIKKIIYVDPLIVSLQNNREDEADPDQTEKLEAMFKKLLKKEEKKNKIKMEFLFSNDDDTDSQIDDLANDLLPLRNDLITSIQLQNNPLNYNRNSSAMISKQVFVVPVKISPNWSYLSDRYQTRYFGFFGVFHGKYKTLVTNYVFDVNKSELVYQSVLSSRDKVSYPLLANYTIKTFQKMNDSK